MNTEEFLTFPYNYICDTKPGWPERNEQVVQARADNNHLLSGSGDFLQLRIYPESRPSWFAEIEMVDKSRGSAIFSTPHRDRLLVKAGWRGYIVDTATLEITQLDIEPLTQVVPDLFRQTLWCVDWCTVAALNKNCSVQMRSDAMVWDDLEILAINEDSMLITGDNARPELRIPLPHNSLPATLCNPFL